MERAKDTPVATSPEPSKPAPSPAAPSESVASLTVGQLLGEIRGQVALLVRKQIELAGAEVREDLKAEARAAGGLGVAAVGGIITVTLLLVTLIFALSRTLPGWGAGLIVSAVVLLASAAAGLLAWRKRVRAPLEKTRRALKEDVQWGKEHLA
jgi:uncharacterized membrane protein YqjE